MKDYDPREVYLTLFPQLSHPFQQNKRKLFFQGKWMSWSQDSQRPLLIYLQESKRLLEYLLWTQNSVKYILRHRPKRRYLKKMMPAQAKLSSSVQAYSKFCHLYSQLHPGAYRS